MAPAGIAIFLLACLVCAVSWFYGIIELRRIRRCNPKVFGKGPVILSVRQEAVAVPADARSLQAKSIALVALADGQVGILPRVGSLLNPIEGLRTLFLYTAVASRTGGTLRVVVRAPLGSSIFIGAWLAGWFSFSLLLAPSAACEINGVAYPRGSADCSGSGLIAGFVVVVIVALLTFITRLRARRHIEELRGRIAGITEQVIEAPR